MPRSHAVKNLIKKLAIFALPFALLLKPAGIAHAIFHDELISALKGEVLSALMDGFQWVGTQVAYWISYLATFLISLAGAMIKILIDAGSEVISNPLTTTGFKISLDVANLGFVLAIIVIAFTTMFRVSGYETKKLLRNLIFAAVIVNFSLTIAGALLDLSNVFGNFFLSAASPGDRAQFADNLANSLNVQKLTGLKIDASQPGGASLFSFGAGFLSIFVTLAASAIFNVLLVITFFAIALMLLIRYIYIVFLLVVMPVAWLMWIFPGYSHLFGDWWKQYMKWIVFYPAVTFFLYLSIASATGIGDVIEKASSGAGAIGAADSIAKVGKVAIIGFIQIFVQVGLMLGGLFAANKLGIEGSAGAMKMAQGARSWITGAAGRATGLPSAYRGLKGTGAVAGTAAAGTVANALNSKALRWIPGAKSAAANLYNVAEARKSAVGALQKEEFEKDSDNAILTKFDQFTADKVKKAAIANEIVKRGLTGKVNKARFEDDYLVAARDVGATKDIIEKRPDLAPKVKDLKKSYPNLPTAQAEIAAIEEAMQKFKPSNTEGLSIDALKDGNVVKNLREAHLARLGKEGTEAQRIAVANAAKELPPDHLVVKYVNNNPAYQGAIGSSGIFKVEIKKTPEKPSAPGL